MTSEIKVDTISENTSANGVTIDGLTIKDGNIVGDVALAGTTPTFTIGDAGAEDAALIFDGNAQDFYIALDDSADDLIIGLGAAVGTTPMLSFTEAKAAAFTGAVSMATTLTLTGNADFNGDLDVDGTSNLDVVDIDGALTQDGGAVFNEAAADVDFRIESSGNDHMFFVDAGNNHINIGTSSDLGGNLNVNGGIVVSRADNGDNLTLISTDTDANYGPNIEMSRPVTGATNDLLGRIDFSGQDAAGNTHNYFSIEAIIDDATSGAEFGRMLMRTEVNGATKNMIDMNGAEIVLNEDSVDYDFRVEGDTRTHLFFVNAVNDNNSSGSIGMNSTNSDGNFLELNNSVGGVYCANLINSENDASTTLHGIRVFFSAQNKDDNSSNYFVGQNTGAVRVIIHSDGDIVNHDGAYNAISDERIKEQIADASSQWDDIKALKMRKFKFKSDIAEKGDSNALWRLGVVAQELEASGMNGLVKPEVTYKAGDQETKDYPYTEDDRKQGAIPDGKDVGDIKQAKTADVGDIKQYKEVKYSILHTKALKALQEAMAKIEDLQARVTTLEG